MNLPAAFKTFYERIVLGKKQIERIDSASDTLINKLKDHYSLSSEEVFQQGSYPNGTAVKPDPDRPDGEYDIDIVSVSARPDATPENAIKELEDALDELGYGDRFDRDSERPCVRLTYAKEEIGDFHVDVIPARPSSGEAPLEIPRPGHGWHLSAPKEYTEWCKDQGEQFARTVQMLKRWRSHSQDARKAIKSIHLQVLVSENLDDSPYDDERVAQTLRNIQSSLAPDDEPPVLWNPVLVGVEDLGKRWKPEDYRDFKKILGEAVELADRGISSLSETASHAAWIELFGSDFPDAGGGGGLPAAPPPAPGSTAGPKEAPRRGEWAS